MADCEPDVKFEDINFSRASFTLGVGAWVACDALDFLSNIDLAECNRFQKLHKKALENVRSFCASFF